MQYLPNYKIASADGDIVINKSLKSILMVLPNNVKKLYDVSFVALE